MAIVIVGDRGMDGDLMIDPLQQGNGASLHRKTDREWTLYFLMKISNQMLKECHESRKYNSPTQTIMILLQSVPN